MIIRWLHAAGRLRPGCLALGLATGASAMNPTVYIAGSSIHGTMSTACYWKNGVKTLLPAPGSAQANANHVWRKSVYVAGSYSAEGRSIACCWVNGRRTDLPGAD